jgi:hypothetical protein
MSKPTQAALAKQGSNLLLALDLAYGKDLHSTHYSSSLMITAER